MTMPRSSCGCSKELYRRLVEQKIPIDHVSDHGISISVYFRDPDGNGVEVSYELPRSQWYRQEKIFLSDDWPHGCFPGPWRGPKRRRQASTGVITPAPT